MKESKWEHFRDRIEINSPEFTETPYTWDRSAKGLARYKEEELKKSQTPQERLYLDPSDRLHNAGRRANHYGYLARIEEQTEKLAKERNLMLISDQKLQMLAGLVPKKVLGGRLTLENPTTEPVKLPPVNAETSKARLSTIFTNKREGVRDFVEKKRQILLARMNIMIKMDEANRLTEFIMNQEESLNVQEADFNSDNTFAKKWISELARETDEATKKTEDEARERQRKQEEINRLKIEEDFWSRKIAETQQELENLREYKRLFEELNAGKKTDENENKSKQPDVKGEPSSSAFLITQQKDDGTQNDPNVEEDDEDSEKAAAREQTKIMKNFRQPEEIFQLINDFDNRNYFMTKHVQALEDEYEKERKTQEAQRIELDKMAKDGQESIHRKSQLRKQEQLRQEKLNYLKTKDHVQALQLSDTGNINMKLIRNRILEIFHKCLKTEKIDERIYKEAPELAKDLEYIQDITMNQQEDSKVMANLLRVIEKALNYYSKFKQSAIDSNELDMIKKLEKKIDQDNKQIKQLAKRIEQDKKKEESNKKNVERVMQPIKKRIGRKDMYKKPFEKEKDVRSLAATMVVKQEDDDEKFFKENYDFEDFADVVKNKSRLMKDALSKSVVMS